MEEVIYLKTVTKMNNVKWREFDFIEIFDIYGGFYNKKPKQELDGDIPFIGATDSNNGITEFYTYKNIVKSSKTGNGKNDEINKKLFEGNCICVTNNGSVGYAYYQPIKFTCSHDVNPLYLKNFTLNKNLALFLISAIEKQRVCFEYSRKWRPKRMIKSKIMLPIDEKGNPDYVYMTNYISDIVRKELDTYEKYCLKELNLLSYKPIEALNEKKWKSFLLISDELFKIEEVYTLKSTSITNNFDEYDVVGATSKNNGNVGFLGEKYYSLINSGNCICLIKTGEGSVGEAVYKSNNFIASNNISVIRCSNLNKYNGLFITNQINKQASRYSYGYIRNNERIKMEKIMLPVNECDEPDFSYMEQYVKNEMIILYKTFLELIKI